MLTDFSMCMMADEATLSCISEGINPIIIAMTQGTAGCTVSISTRPGSWSVPSTTWMAK